MTDLDLAPAFDALDTQLLRQLAGPGGYERGLGYFRAGNASTVEAVSADVVRASVSGASTYVTQLLARGGVIRASCSCPIGQRGEFCKHAVTIGLHLLDQLDRLDPDIRRDESAAESQTPRMPRVARTPRAARTTTPSLRRQAPVDAAELRAQLQDAFRFSGMLDYWSAARWAPTAWQAVDNLARLLPDDPAAAIKLTEYAFRRLNATYQRMDDDGGVGDVLHRIQQVHLEACRIDPGNQRALAKRLFALETQYDLDPIVDGLATYAEPLGEVGQAAYRELAADAWQAQQLEPRGTTPLSDYLDGSYRFRRIMEQIARLDRDVDALVQLIGRDLEAAHRFTSLATALIDIGERDAAREWARRGLERHAADDGLLEVLLTCARADGHDDEALELAWQLFEQRRDVNRFDELRACAEQLDAWPAWRDRAIESALAATSRDGTHAVQLLLHLGDVDAAWAAAHAHGCASTTWEQLAVARASEHPADAAAVYLRFAREAITYASTRQYDQATTWLTRADALLGTPSERALFDAALAELRTTHIRKRAFLNRLDSRGW